MHMAQRAARSLRTRAWTRADLARLPDDGNRYEVLDGALLVTPQAAFEHQAVAARLTVALASYCEALELGVVVAPGAIPHGKSELQPDVQVVPGRPPRSAKWTSLPRPILVVEVLSDSTSRRDLGIKRDAYLRWEIPEYWAVDLDARCVHVFRAGSAEGEVVEGTLVWRPAPPNAPLELRVADLFR
ncbi:MAG: Uma2 family endonuclease [Candidatus Omnitrophota bacterium]|jgi:Uma2 family endonuclease